MSLFRTDRALPKERLPAMPLLHPANAMPRYPQAQGFPHQGLQQHSAPALPQPPNKTETPGGAWERLKLGQGGDPSIGAWLGSEEEGPGAWDMDSDFLPSRPHRFPGFPGFEVKRDSSQERTDRCLSWLIYNPINPSTSGRNRKTA